MSNTSTPYKHTTTASHNHKDPHHSRPSHPSSEHPYFSQPRPLVKPKPQTAVSLGTSHHQYRASNNTTPNTSANASSRQNAVSGGPPVAAYGSSRLPLDNSALHNLSGLSNSSTSHQADYNQRHHRYSHNNSHNQSAVNSSSGFRSENTYGHANRSGNGPRNSSAAATSRKSRNNHQQQHDTSVESSSTAAGVLEGYCSFESMEYMRSIGLL